MYSSMWFMSIVALLVVDVRTGALQDQDIRARCYSCPRVNGSTCETASFSTVICPADQPLCATVAIAPDFASTLTCTEVTKTTCSLKNPTNSSLELTCVCNSHLCNAPFSPTLRKELLNFTFTHSNNKVRDMQDIFFLTSTFRNVTKENLYKAITIEIAKVATNTAMNSSKLTTATSATATVNTQPILRDSEKPRAEPLKQEPTVPSDDDEDESEGSGAYEESRVHNHVVSGPAAPSSFLPANENSATPLYKNLLVASLFIYFVV